MKHLFHNKAQRVSMPATKLDGIVGSIQQSLNQAGVSFAGKDVARAALSLESIDSATALELDSAVQGLSTALESIASQHNLTGLTSAQKAAATAIGVIGADVGAYLNAPLKRDVVAQEGMTFVNPQGSGDFFDSRMRQALEAYDEKENRNAVVYSVAYNLQAARQDEFGETLFPTVVVTPDQVGFTVSIRLIMVYNEVRRNVSGALDNFGKRNIIQAVIDPTILKNDMLRIVPVYRPESADKFVDSALLAPRDVNLEGETITTSALGMNKKFSLLGISQTEALLETGLLDSTDSIDTAVVLQALYLRVAGGTPEAIKFNTARLPYSTFTYSVQNNYRMMSLNFTTNSLKIDKDTKLVDGSASTLLAIVATKKLTVRLSVAVSGNVNLETAETTLFANELSVVSVKDEQGVELSLTAGDGKAVVDALAAAGMVGYDLEARRTNLNRRQRGQLLDTTFYNQVYAVPLRSPITVPRPLTSSDATDSSDLAALITATHIRTSNAAVDELLRVSEILKETVSSTDGLNDTPEILGVSRYLVKPFFEHADLDVAAEVDSLKSFERAADVQALLVNKLRDMAYRMYRDSNYKAAADALAGGQSAVPTVIIATDPVLSRYLTVSGDFRTLGNDFNVKVVSTLNERMKGKIFMTFGDFSTAGEGVPNPMHFGNMAWKPEMTLVLPLHRNGANSKELTVQPSFIHIVNLPVLASLEVEGISDVIASKNALWMKTAP